MSVLALIADIAARQHGAVSQLQLLVAGASPGSIRRARERGDLIRAGSSVYVVAGAPRTWRQQLMVAVLDAGPGACASHRAAAILLGIAHRDAPEVVEISVPGRRSGRIGGAVVHRNLDLVDDHITVVDGIPCAGVLRTLIDLGAVEPHWVVKDALERSLQAKLTTIRGCEWMLARLSERGRTGCGVFRLVLTERELKAASPHKGLLEPRYAGPSRRFHLPPYSYQHKVFDDDGMLVAQLDFAYPELKVAIEVDGFETHGTPDAMTKDFERDHVLELKYGWRVLHFTWFQVLKRPSYVAQQVRLLLDARTGALRP